MLFEYDVLRIMVQGIVYHEYGIELELALRIFIASHHCTQKAVSKGYPIERRFRRLVHAALWPRELAALASWSQRLDRSSTCTHQLSPRWLCSQATAVAICHRAQVGRGECL